MHIDQYTPEVVCQCLGLAGFEVTHTPGGPIDWIRLLLQPSFDPEVCLTISKAATAANVSVVAARRMIWHQLSPAPMLTDRDQGRIILEGYQQLAEALRSAAASSPTYIAICDGMQVDGIVMSSGEVTNRFRRNVSDRSLLGEAVSQAIAAAWGAVQSPYCRNALAAAGRYSGLELAPMPEPPRKPIIKTVVLGPEEDRHQLLKALDKQKER